ncbi:MAG: DNA-directed RNA polymerase subunit omega [Deferribacterales bacterium]|nr:DNA-directed RNA polymerase subunit omega [Deferribacterales bacterium]
MSFLDIEKTINLGNVGSRFKLVHLAGLRAKELNNPNDDTYISGYKSSQKVTSQALEDLVFEKVNFSEGEIPEVVDNTAEGLAPEETDKSL